MGAKAADDSGPTLYGAIAYNPNEILAQMKFGVVSTTEGMFRIQDVRVGIGIFVMPGGRLLSTYKGGSPMYVPRTIPNIFSSMLLWNR